MDPKDLTLQTLYTRVKDHPDPTTAILPTATLVMELPFSWQESSEYLLDLIKGGYVAAMNGNIPAVALTSRGIDYISGLVA